MMARITSVGPEAFSRSDRISNGLSTAMRDHKSLNPSRVDMLLGLASPQSQSPIVFDAHELNEEDVWGSTDVKASPEENIPLPDVWKFESGNFGGAEKDAVEVAADPFRFVNNGRRWLGREKDSGLSVAYADTGRSRAFPSPLNRAAVNASGTFSSREAFSGRTASRLILNRDGKVISHFAQLSSAAEARKVSHQSAPVNVPDWSKILGNERKPEKEFVDDYVVPENDEDEERLPPHVLIAREYARSQVTPFSMCDGAGGTLKGRDLSRVRNAVLRQTGFLNDH